MSQDTELELIVTKNAARRRDDATNGQLCQRLLEHSFIVGTGDYTSHHIASAISGVPTFVSTQLNAPASSFEFEIDCHEIAAYHTINLLTFYTGKAKSYKDL
jgi:hypothetical protein